MSIKLYGYWRSSASYRVRIALNLKQLDYENIPVHLVQDGGEHHKTAYQALNPAQLLPTLVDDDEDIILNQSMAIIEYLDERYPEHCSLMSKHIMDRARIRTLSQDIGCDMQPLANLRVLNYLSDNFSATPEDKTRWAQHWIEKGFKGIEKRIQNTAGEYCFGFDLSMADVCLVPQVYNAKRFGVDMQQFPVISRIAERCNKLDAFITALPENQSDAG
ncbi:MAG: maleylacetoacetate isomerase [Paraglaciecola sp.]|jgi:maleylacetoacetate isomerase